MKEKCIICESGHSTWVNEQHDAGLSTRQIAAELKEKFGLSVSHVSIATHLNHGDKSDIMAELEARIRNLELWVLKSIPAETAVTWFEHGITGEQKFSISNHTLYQSTIPNFDGLAAEEAALKAEIVSKHKEESAALKEQQRREAVKRNESIAAEKREREEQAKRAKEMEEKERIDALREQVAEFDKKTK